MEIKKFNAYAFFSDIWSKNRLIQGAKFGLSRVNGIGTLPNLLADKKHSNFFAIDTSSDAKYFQGGNGGWYKRRVFTLFVIMKCKTRKEGEREEKLETCQEITRQIISYMIKQESIIANTGIRLNSKQVASHEFEEWVLTNAAGCYIVFNVDEPIRLIFKADEWDE